MVIVLPAVGAAVAGVREQGQHRFHEERAGRAAKRLERLRQSMRWRAGLRGVCSLATQTQAVLLDESSSWTGLAEFQDLELIV
jgi:hypothetical protein